MSNRQLPKPPGRAHGERAKRVHFRPSWLEELIPANVHLVMEQLAEVQALNKVSDSQMTMYIRVASQMDTPLLETITKFATGELTLTMHSSEPEALGSSLIHIPPRGRNNA